MIKKLGRNISNFNLSFFCVVWLLFYSSCQHQSATQDIGIDTFSKDSISKSEIIAMDTVPYKTRNELIVKYIKQFEKEPDHNDNPYYWIFKSLERNASRNKDSINAFVSHIDTVGIHADIYALRQYLILNSEIIGGDNTPADQMKKIIYERNKVYDSKSVFVYLLDDLLAMGFYNGRNPQKSLLYTEEYIKHHPLNTNVRIKQRYYDIRFMLSQLLENRVDMKNYLDSCRQLAIVINDSTALMRTLDYEAQLHAAMGHPDKAVTSLRKFFNYLQKKDKLQFYAFNNLAKAFLDNNQPDSTIKYILWAEKWGIEKKMKYSISTSELDLLSNAYTAKGDFKKAFEAKKKQFDEYRENIVKMQQEKIAELSTKYESQRKDQDIQSLKSTNKLNERVLLQQRSIFVILFLFLAFALLFTYKVYKQKLLKAKHDQLVIQNKHFVLEQKNRQNQLNPHFIYNAIANLQGLIGANKKQEANTYLVVLTKLIRDILELNRQDFITLEQEIKSLRNYILLQQMRFSDSFDFQIETSNLDLEDVMIPPMLIQPFVENAIEYGLKNIKYKGLLQISFQEESSYLIVNIEDNGQGLKSIKDTDMDKESLSQVITQERLELLYGNEIGKGEFEVFPNYKAGGDGYKVVIRLPLKRKFN